mgnify:CR=1 FL=1
MRGQSRPGARAPRSAIIRVIRVSGFRSSRPWTQKIGSTKRMPPSATQNASCQMAMRVAPKNTFGSETDTAETALPEMSRSTNTASSGPWRNFQNETPEATSSRLSVKSGAMPWRERVALRESGPSACDPALIAPKTRTLRFA